MYMMLLIILSKLACRKLEGKGAGIYHRYRGKRAENTSQDMEGKGGKGGDQHEVQYYTYLSQNCLR